MRFSTISALLLAPVVTLAAPHGQAQQQQQNKCADVTVIYARGNNDACSSGNGVGANFKAKLSAQLQTQKQTMDFQEVDYESNSYLTAMAKSQDDDKTYNAFSNSVATTINKCEKTKIVLAGYSQGSQIVHRLSDKLSAAHAIKIQAVVTFGDAWTGLGFHNGLGGKSQTYCNADDYVCSKGSNNYLSGLGLSLNKITQSLTSKIGGILGGLFGGLSGGNKNDSGASIKVPSQHQEYAYDGTTDKAASYVASKCSGNI